MKRKRQSTPSKVKEIINGLGLDSSKSFSNSNHSKSNNNSKNDNNSVSKNGYKIDKNNGPINCTICKINFSDDDDKHKMENQYWKCLCGAQQLIPSLTQVYICILIFL